jgi:sugar phosphate isomerase/epimerase
MFKNLNPFVLGVTGHQSEIIELALTYGFEGVTLNMADFAGRVRRRGMEHARRLIDSAGIRIGSFPLPFDWDVDDDEFKKAMEKLPEYAEAAAAIDCTRCTAVVAPAGDKRPYHENFEYHRHRFADICRALAPSGIKLGIGFRAAEFHRKDQAFQFIHDFDAVSLLMNMVEADNIGVLLDVWELTVCGAGLDVLHNLKPEQIVAVEVAELDREVADLTTLDEKSRLQPNDARGRVDVPAALRTLRQMGYDGPITPTPSRGALATRRRDAIVKQTGEAIDLVWQAAELPTESRPYSLVGEQEEVATPKPA